MFQTTNQSCNSRRCSFAIFDLPEGFLLFLAAPTKSKNQQRRVNRARLDLCVFELLEVHLLFNHQVPRLGTFDLQNVSAKKMRYPKIHGLSH
jgi:hypothetical protein